MSAVWSRRRLIGALAGTAGASVLLPAAAAAQMDDHEASSGDDLSPSTADLGFLADMSAHHIQALAMCERVLGRDTGDAVQAAATEVLRNQAIEVGTMRAWLADWGASTRSPELVMGWMGAGDGAGMPIGEMPGYASDDEMFELADLEGPAQGRRWLELMRAHHIGGVAMAEMATGMVATEKVGRLARTQALVQAFEIEQYDQLLAGPYAEA